jgi:hypothetical protein
VQCEWLSGSRASLQLTQRTSEAFPIYLKASQTSDWTSLFSEHPPVSFNTLRADSKVTKAWWRSSRINT